MKKDILNFEIIPVIDILNSVAVHAKKGKRDQYRPLNSVLFHTIDPLNIIKVLHGHGFNKIYIADLDAITNQRPNMKIIKKTHKMQNLNLIIDLGIKNLEDYKYYLSKNIQKLIIGLETIESLNELSRIFQFSTTKDAIVSIDMKNGKILSKNQKLALLRPTEVVDELIKIGVKEIILLDLDRVGQKIGGTPKLFLKIKENFNGNIYVGGGIKNFDDIKLYMRKGFSGLLIGTALHEGIIKYKEIKQFLN